MQIILPYPDFKESAAVLSDQDLKAQIKDVIGVVEEILQINDESDELAVKEAERWIHCEMQLVEYGLTCVDELESRELEDRSSEHKLEWLLEATSEDGRMDKPLWFGELFVHENWQKFLVEHDPDFYTGKFDV
jgi:hypothetical protein